MKLMWQYDFRDCYTVNRHTGAYQLSHAFEERIADINAWTMGADFFKRYPELYGDIPSFVTYAAPMDTISAPRPQNLRRRPLPPTPPAAVVEEVLDDEPTSATTRTSTQSLKSELPAAHQPAYPYQPSMMPSTPFPATPSEPMPGIGHGYLNGHENGVLPMAASQFVQTWEMQGSNPMPQQDWLWYAGGLGPGLPEPV